jgi:DNA-binding protein Fis
LTQSVVTRREKRWKFARGYNTPRAAPENHQTLRWLWAPISLKGKNCVMTLSKKSKLPDERKPDSVMAEAAGLALLAGMTPNDAAVELEIEMIELSLQQNRANQCRTARELHMHRNTLKRKIDLSTRLQQAVRHIRESQSGSRYARRAVRQLELYQTAKPVSHEQRLDHSRVA